MSLIKIFQNLSLTSDMSWYNVISQNSIYYPEMLHVAEISKFPGNWVVLKSFTMLFLVLSFISSVQFSRSVVSDSLRPHESHSRSSLRLRSIESVMPPSHLILCRPLLLLPPIPPRIRVFSNESTLHMRWPKYWSFSFSIIPSKEIPRLIPVHQPQASCILHWT